MNASTVGKIEVAAKPSRRFAGEVEVPAVTAPTTRLRMQPRSVRVALVCPTLLGATPAFTQPTSLRIATGQSPPFVVLQSDQLSGFDVDLWTELAWRLGAGVIVTDLGPRSIEAQLEAVRNGQLDMALSAIAMTPEREALLDFSTAYFDSGLQIMVRRGAGGAWRAARAAVFSPAIGHVLLAASLVVLLLANVLWLVERRRNPYFQRGYVCGILEGLWGVKLISL